MAESSLTIHVHQETGVILRIISTLLRAQCGIERQAIGQPDGSGVSQIQIDLKAGAIVDEALKSALLEVDGVIRVVEIERNPTNSVTLVRLFGLDLDREQRQKALFALGRQFGRKKYRSDYAEGSPLQLGPALARIVVHALQPIATAEARGDSVHFPNCPLCDLTSGHQPSCSFFSGMIQGLVEEAPLTKGCSVTETSCRAAGGFGNACIFDVKPAT
jgi:predicted hydrocarbon binding protein